MNWLEICESFDDLLLLLLGGFAVGYILHKLNDYSEKRKIIYNKRMIVIDEWAKSISGFIYLIEIRIPKKLDEFRIILSEGINAASKSNRKIAEGKHDESIKLIEDYAAIEKTKIKMFEVPFLMKLIDAYDDKELINDVVNLTKCYKGLFDSIVKKFKNSGEEDPLSVKEDLEKQYNAILDYMLLGLDHSPKKSKGIQRSKRQALNVKDASITD